LGRAPAGACVMVARLRRIQAPNSLFGYTHHSQCAGFLFNDFVIEMGRCAGDWAGPIKVVRHILDTEPGIMPTLVACDDTGRAVVVRVRKADIR